MVVIRLDSCQRRAPIYSVKQGTEQALASLLASCRGQLPSAFVHAPRRLVFKDAPDDDVHFPSPLKEQEALAAIKALEGAAAAAFANLREDHQSPREITIDMSLISCFLMSAYLCTLDGLDKADPRVKNKIPDTDLNQAQTVFYRRLSANLYETKTPGEFYHIHGSLEASATLCMIGLPPFNPRLQDYRECIETIESAVRRFTVDELEEMNRKEAQAGVPVLTAEQFRATPQGQALAALPPFTIQPFESSTAPAPLGQQCPVNPGTSSLNQCLRGIRVLELCRVIAGPTIGRTLASHGASVLKVTSPYLPDVPFFQVDVNTGKHTTSLHLHDPVQRLAFEALIASADVVLDGYRPGVLTRLGYGPDRLAKLAAARGKGYVYVAEDCFGGSDTPVADQAVWSDRPGWQQIADCVTGVAWEQGRFMGLNEPVVPPFPMSDYGTGALGCVAAMAGLYRRATEGGSWMCRTSLCQYDMFLLSLGTHSFEVQTRLRMTHDPAFFELRHHDSVDEVGKRALKSMRKVRPALFEDIMMHTAWSHGFNAEVRWPREALQVKGVDIGHVRATRPNGCDEASWKGWEEQPNMVADLRL
ncbi:Acetyl-coenzyme A transferase nodX like protein [Verticillium longisporum]|nr:Acetyl-coenzyme A transferase nodX like protein [Verticillium longisporum]